MGIQEFPEIETFQKLPRHVIVKGGSAGFDSNGKPELRGIVINNCGHPIKELCVSLVVFDAYEIPLFNVSTNPDPARLQQGGIGPFTFVLDHYKNEIANYYLYADWKYDD